MIEPIKAVKPVMIFNYIIVIQCRSTGFFHCNLEGNELGILLQLTVAEIKFFLHLQRIVINFFIAITADHSQDVTSDMNDFFVLYYINSI